MSLKTQILLLGKTIMPRNKVGVKTREEKTKEKQKKNKMLLEKKVKLTIFTS